VGKKKGKKKPAAVEAPKAVKLTHNPADFALWEKLGFSAPASSKDCVALHEQLLEKKEWLKTAPPKAKKPKEEPKPEVKEVAADAEPEFDMAKAKAEEAAELKIKQEKERIKAEEAAKAEADRIAKMHELEGQGKKVSGGMHKFDASEVDVHGGDATADDFMDAFGFGGDEGGDAANVGDDPIVTVEATSGSSVNVTLKM